MDRASLVKHLENLAKETPIINTHEHIVPQSQIKAVGLWGLLKNSYLRLDLISAGMSPLIWEEEGNWEDLAPYLPAIGNTSYFRCLQVGLAELFRLEGPWDAAFYKKLAQELTKANTRDDWYHYVLSQGANYQISILDQFWDVCGTNYDSHVFSPTFRVDLFFSGFDPQFIDRHGNSLEQLALNWGGKLDTFADFLDLFALGFQRTKDQGGLCIKLAMAYERDLDFGYTEEARAKELYGRRDLNPGEVREFHDFMLHTTIRLCEEYDFPLQIHTGMLARNEHSWDATHPGLLRHLFLAYPTVNFIIFHTGYPYYREGAILAKMFPNVYYDLVWLPIISSSAAQTALPEILDLVPGNKILWGGDGHCVEESYGASILMKRVLTQTLAEKIIQGDFDLSTAEYLVQGILRDNGRKLFRLE